MRSAFPRNLLTSGWKVWNCEYRKKRRRLKRPIHCYIACVNICILDGVAAVQHFSTAHIDTHMGNARCIVSADEKDQVAGSCVGRRYRGGNIVESLGSQPGRIADAALRQRPGYEAGAIKRSVRIAAAPDIRIANVLLRLGNERRKGFIFQCGRRDIIGGGRFGVLVYIAGAWEQIFPVPQRCHIDRIQGKRFFVHDVDRHMG